MSESPLPQATVEDDEARIAPAVTREDVEECVYGSRRAGRECDSQGFVPVHVQEAVEHLCVLFGVPVEQDTDPVMEKARELARAGGIDFDEQEPMGVEMLIGMARHVLRQGEDHNVDQ